MSVPSGLLEGVFVLTAAVAALLLVARRLPLQNVLLAGVVVALGGAMTGVVATRVGIWTFATNAGPRPFGGLPWWFPCLWVAVLLSSRGSALCLLRSRQTTARFGWEVLSLTTGLSLILLATAGWHARRNDYWSVPPGDLLVSIAACGVGTVFILLVATPILINKKPVSTPPDYRPLVLWLLLTLLLLVSVMR
jgi:hypothetical protein